MPASREHFDWVLQCLNSWPTPDTFELAFTYAAEHLADWPDSMRWATPELCWPGFPDHAPLPGFGLVKSFHLKAYQIGDRELELLARSPHICELTGLNLFNNKITNLGVRHLAASWYVQSLERLDLGWNDIRDAGAAAIAGSAKWPHLTTLSLRDNPISTEGYKALGFSRFLADPVRQRFLSKLPQPVLQDEARKRELPNWESMDTVTLWLALLEHRD